MKKMILLLVAVTATIAKPTGLFSQKNVPLSPMGLHNWTLTFAGGDGTPYWGNGKGIGPATKVIFETGMWDLGPGILTLGGEATISFFGNIYDEKYRENWTNFLFAARCAYHYGWNVKGLDTYAGIPLGLGFTIHTEEYVPGASGYQPVFPYGGFFLGTSYFFNDYLGINGEVGYNSTLASIGLIIRLR
jgi:hypothetical protein